MFATVARRALPDMAGTRRGKGAPQRARLSLVAPNRRPHRPRSVSVSVHVPSARSVGVEHRRCAVDNCSLLCATKQPLAPSSPHLS